MSGIPPEKGKRERLLEEALSFPEEPQEAFGVFSVHHRPTDTRQSVMATAGGLGATASVGSGDQSTSA